MTVADTHTSSTGPISIARWRQAWLTIDQNPAAQSWAASIFGSVFIAVAFAALSLG